VCVNAAKYHCHALKFTLLFRVDSSMEIFSLSIQHEALYFPKLLGIMKIPRDHTDFECLEEGLPIMLAAQVRPFSFHAFFSFITAHSRLNCSSAIPSQT